MNCPKWVKKKNETNMIFTEHNGDLLEDEIMSIYGLNKAVLGIIRKLGYKLDTRNLYLNGCAHLSPCGTSNNDDMCDFHTEIKHIKMQIDALCRHMGIVLEYQPEKEAIQKIPSHYIIKKR